MIFYAISSQKVRIPHALNQEFWHTDKYDNGTEHYIKINNTIQYESLDNWEYIPNRLQSHYVTLVTLICVLDSIPDWVDSVMDN